MAAIAAQMVPGARRMTSGVAPTRLPSWATFFENETALVVLVHADAPLIDAASALVFAVHHSHDRIAHVALPAVSRFDDLLTATRMRSAYLDRTSVWTFESGVATRTPTMLELEVQEALRSAGSRHRSAPVGQGVDWVEALQAWSDLTGLHADRGRGKWYLRGALILQLTGVGSGWRLRVGAAHAERAPDTYEWASDAVPTAKQWADIALRIQHDLTSSWFAERPLTYAEHDLQTSIGRGAIDLGWIAQRPLLREYPLTRPSGGAGYIDLLGVDQDGVARIVETKLGTSDRMLALQGLDYWLWVRSNKALVESDLSASFDDVALDFVLGSKPGAKGTELLNQYQPALLRRLPSDLRWELHQVPVATDELKAVRSFGERHLPW